MDDSLTQQSELNSTLLPAGLEARPYQERIVEKVLALFGGTATGRGGLRLIFEDSGPGIASIESAMRDGFSTGRGLGKGLPGSKRLVDEFQIESEMGSGTRVTIVRWL